MQRTYSQPTADISRAWYEIDAANLALGRLSTKIARVLTGKDKPTYTPHIDNGDYVIVTNVSQIKLSGRKHAEKKFRHSGYTGNLKATAKSDILSNNPEKLLVSAVSGMIPKNRLHKARLHRLKVYNGESHEHSAQKPRKLEVNK